MTNIIRTMAPSGPWASGTPVLTSLMDAIRELREARLLLRGGNVIHGVKRHNQAKNALYLLLQGSLPVDHASVEPDDRLLRLLDAGVRFRDAFVHYRHSGAASTAALALTQAESVLIEALDHIEQVQ